MSPQSNNAGDNLVRGFRWCYYKFVNSTKSEFMCIARSYLLKEYSIYDAIKALMQARFEQLKAWVQHLLILLAC